jgi:hypothetical protein
MKAAIVAGVVVGALAGALIGWAGAMRACL